MKRKFHLKRSLVILVPIIFLSLIYPLGEFLNSQPNVFWHTTFFNNEVLDNLLGGFNAGGNFVIAIVVLYLIGYWLYKLVNWIYAKD
jgi:membrane-bound acyltransferase YfiQ involved in biofilm formation